MRILWIALVLVFSSFPYLSHSQVVAQQAADNEVSADALNHEKLAWELTKKKDKAGLAKLLSEDFTEITEDGVFDRDQILANLDVLTLTSYPIGSYSNLTRRASHPPHKITCFFRPLPHSP